MKRRLIINADDYGLTAGCDSAIAALVTQGVVTSASCLVFEREPRYFPALPHAGVHLRLTGRGRPLSPLALIPSLVDSSGNFPAGSTPAFLLGLRPEEVRIEWDAQIRAFLRTNAVGAVTHLDSHHHVHGFMNLWDVYRDLCVSYGTAGVSLSSGQRTHLRALDIRCADFTETRWTDGMGKTLATLLAEDFKRCGSVHLMTHPGADDEALARVSTMTATRAAECRLLSSSGFQDWLKENEIEVIPFAEL